MGVGPDPGLIIMRVMTWNVHGANKESQVWRLLLEFRPDIVLLQEVQGIPEEISEEMAILSRVAIYKTGRPQRFSTAVLVDGKIIEEIKLKSEYDWVNDELSFFHGNFIACKVVLQNNERLNVVSVYSPAWPVNEERLKGIDVSA
ncbi:MAG: endonuclease/exonuclease/phosphatase family protein, partial [Thermoplasmata archaeon]